MSTRITKSIILKGDITAYPFALLVHNLNTDDSYFEHDENGHILIFADHILPIIYFKMCMFPTRPAKCNCDVEIVSIIPRNFDDLEFAKITAIKWDNCRWESKNNEIKCEPYR